MTRGPLPALVSRPNMRSSVPGLASFLAPGDESSTRDESKDAMNGIGQAIKHAMRSSPALPPMDASQGEVVAQSPKSDQGKSIRLQRLREEEVRTCNQGGKGQV